MNPFYNPAVCAHKSLPTLLSEGFHPYRKEGFSQVRHLKGDLRSLPIGKQIPIGVIDSILGTGPVVNEVELMAFFNSYGYKTLTGEAVWVMPHLQDPLLIPLSVAAEELILEAVEKAHPGQEDEWVAYTRGCWAAYSEEDRL